MVIRASRCPLGIPMDPWITKIVTQGTKMEPQGFQKIDFAYTCDPFQQATSLQLPADRGAGGRAEPSNIPSGPWGLLFLRFTLQIILGGTASQVPGHLRLPNGRRGPS